MHRKQIRGATIGAGTLLLLSFLGGNRWYLCLILAVVGGVGGFVLPLWFTYRNRRKEIRMITMDMADYLTSVSLLMTAGLTLWDAMRRSLWGCDLKRPLYREISGAFEAYEQGNTVDQLAAFQTMSEACQIPIMSTFVCALVQNYKKGNGELAALFMELSGTCRRERQALAGKLADEATTLLLIPSTIALIVMVVVLAAPAMLQLI